MNGPNVVVANFNPAYAAALAATLQPYCRSVHVAHSSDELRVSIAKHRAQTVIVDLECFSLVEVEELRRQFPATDFVCTHRLADEVLWTRSLAAGASDCLISTDLAGIIRSTVGRPMARTHAA
jgi:hypothetical protein